jgi:hypothetical protein
VRSSVDLQLEVVHAGDDPSGGHRVAQGVSVFDRDRLAGRGAATGELVDLASDPSGWSGEADGVVDDQLNLVWGGDGKRDREFAAELDRW